MIVYFGSIARERRNVRFVERSLAIECCFEVMYFLCKRASKCETCWTESNGTPAMDLAHTNVVLK